MGRWLRTDDNAGQKERMVQRRGRNMSYRVIPTKRVEEILPFLAAFWFKAGVDDNGSVYPGVIDDAPF